MAILILTIFLLLALIFFQMVHIRRTREQHRQKMEMLRQVIVKLATHSAQNDSQLQLSEDLINRLRSANSAIGRDISEMVSELVETLSDHNLLK